MKRCVLIFMAILQLVTTKVGAQDGYNERAQKYIQQYSTLAMLEQQKNGIPAAITLGQGILETEAGASELMTEANNHFGIKCNGRWQGPTFSHTDDAPDECFKKYSCAAESFRDHSEHLKTNPRYSPLFTLSQTDYASWAVCLKKCGYATNPQYAQRLIKIIEDFKLQEYTYSALHNTSPLDLPSKADEHPNIEVTNELPDDTDKKVTAAEPKTETKRQPGADQIKKTADSARDFINHLQAVNEQAKSDSITDAIANNYANSKLVIVNGLKAFYAYKGEMLLQYAVKFNMRYPKLLEINDLPDAPLAFDAFVYVEKKLASGTHTHHAVKEGESLLMIAQTEGMQLKRLQALNLLTPGEEPAAGGLLSLQFPARAKPALAVKTVAVQKNITIPASAIKAPEARATAPAQSVPSTPAAMDSKDEVSDTEEEVDTTETIPGDIKPGTRSEKGQLAGGDEGKVIEKEQADAPPQSKPVASAKADKGGNKYYTVKKGDTAFSVAKRNNIPLDQLMEWNSITDGGIQVGQTLRIK